MAYPSDRNNVIRNYTGDEATEETELLLELLTSNGLRDHSPIVATFEH